MSTQFYVYGYFNPLKQNEEFYIGFSGDPHRWLKHLKDAKKILSLNKSNKWIRENCENPHKTRTIIKILKAGLEPIIVKVLKDIHKQTAVNEEIRLISVCGRTDLGLGPLTNLTDGGEGGDTRIGKTRSKQHCKEISERSIKYWSLKENRIKQSKKLLGKNIGKTPWNKDVIHTEDEKAVLYANRTGMKRSEKSKENYRKSAQIRGEKQRKENLKSNPYDKFVCEICQTETELRRKEIAFRFDKYNKNICKRGCASKIAEERKREEKLFSFFSQ